MAKGRGKKLKDNGPFMSQPNTKREMKKKNKKKKKKASKVKAPDADPPAPVSLSDSPQAHASPATNSSDADSRGEKKAKNNLNDLSGFIFMCNAMTKPECFRYRVFGLPAGRKDVKNVKKGMKLFLFDFDLKLLYGVYKATSDGQMNLETSAFGGRFPAQVSFAIYEECIPLPESAFRLAIRDNYQGPKFKAELTRRQVKDLIKLFRPFSALTATVATMPQAAPPQAIRHPALENQFQPSVRLPPLQDPYLAGPHHGRAAPVVEPHPVRRRVLNLQHELYGSAATMSRVHPTLDHQGLPASNDPDYFAENRRPYLAEDTCQIVQDQYPRYRAMQEREYHPLPVQRHVEYDPQWDNIASDYMNYPMAATSQPLMHPHEEREFVPQQENVAGYYTTYPMAATSHGPPLMHPHEEREFVPQQENFDGYYTTYATPATSHHGLPLVHPRGQVPERPELPVSNVYPVPATSYHGPSLVYPYGQVSRRPDLRGSNVYPMPATSHHGTPLVHPHGQVPGIPELPVSNVYPMSATPHGPPLVHPHGSVVPGRRHEVPVGNVPIFSYYSFAGAKQVYR